MWSLKCKCSYCGNKNREYIYLNKCEIFFIFGYHTNYLRFCNDEHLKLYLENHKVI